MSGGPASCFSVILFRWLLLTSYLWEIDAVRVLVCQSVALKKPPVFRPVAPDGFTVLTAMPGSVPIPNIPAHSEPLPTIQFFYDHHHHRRRHKEQDDYDEYDSEEDLEDESSDYKCRSKSCREDYEEDSGEYGGGDVGSRGRRFRERSRGRNRGRGRGRGRGRSRDRRPEEGNSHRLRSGGEDFEGEGPVGGPAPSIMSPVRPNAEGKPPGPPPRSPNQSVTLGSVAATFLATATTTQPSSASTSTGSTSTTTPSTTPSSTTTPSTSTTTTTVTTTTATTSTTTPPTATSPTTTPTTTITTTTPTTTSPTTTTTPRWSPARPATPIPGVYGQTGTPAA